MNKELMFVLAIFVTFLFQMFPLAGAAVAVSSCSQDLNASGVYLLTQSITSTSTCLTTNSSNVEIDCAGNIITYGTAGNANSIGIYASHSTTSQTNLTIKNCILVKTSGGGSGGNGIILTRFANSTIVNNTIRNNGTSGNKGIYILTSSSGNNISRNTIVTSGVSTTNYGIYLYTGTADSIVEYNNITTGKGAATTDNYGIYASDPRANITGNIIYTFGSGDSNFGIYSYTSTSARIINNTVYTSGTTGNNRGIFVSTADSNYISNNTINTTGQSSPGIYLSTSGSVNILNNKINSTADAIYMTSATLSDFTLANISRDNTRFGRNITVYGGGALTLSCPNNTVINNPADGALKFFGCRNVTVQNWYRPNRDTDGLLFVNSDNNRIINNTINGGIEGLDMVNTAGMCDNNTIANNTFSSFGYLDAYAIHVYGNYNVITGNNLSTSGVISGNNRINIQNDFNNITNNRISTGGTSGNIGINLESGAINNLIQNNTIVTSGTSGNTGIYFVASCTGNIVRNNTVTVTGTTSGNLGIRLVTNSDNNLVESNTFYTRGLTSGNNGLDLSSSDNNIFRFNNVYVGYGVGTTDNDAISLVSSKNNTFMNNVLFANGTSTSITSSSIFLQSSSTNNTFINNNVIKSVGNAIELDFSTTYPHKNIFQNNSLNNISGADLFFLDANINETSLIDQPIGRYNFTGVGGIIIVEDTRFGKIVFTSKVNGSNGNLSDDIQIKFNFAQVSSAKPGLNATANVSFYNLLNNFYNPVIKRDGLYECNATTFPACVNFTSLNEGNLSFSVSAWSNYSITNASQQPTTTTLSTIPATPISYGVASNFSCSNSGNLALALYINGQDKTSEISQLVTRAAGQYIISCNSTENENYTGSSQQITYNIEKASGDIRLSLNNQENNLLLQSIEQSNITATTLYGNISVYLNGLDITAQNGLNVLRGVGYYNVTAFSSGDENHSSSSQTFWLNITFDSIPPSLNLISPQDGAAYGYNSSLQLKYSVSDINLESCWYTINSGANVTLANCLNSTFNVSGNGNLALTLYANDSYGNLASSSANFSISVGSPSIILNSPINNAYLDHKNISFDYTPSDIDLASCELWGDFIGEFKLNQTDNNPGNNSENYFYLNLIDGNYKWNIRCIDSAGHEAFNGNKTFTVDTVSPTLVITQPTGALTSRNSIPLNFNAADTNLNTCWYNVYRASILEIGNNSINCSSSLTFNVTIDAYFTLNLYVNDSAGNLNSTSSSFSVSTSTSTPPSSSGGGGSSGGSVIVPKESKYLVEFGGISDMIVNPGENRRMSLRVKNAGNVFLNDCKLLGKGNNSGWVSSSEIKKIGPGEIQEFAFSLSVPENSSAGNYGIELGLECIEYSDIASFNAEIIEKKIQIKVGEISRNKADELIIKYSILELSGVDQNVDVEIILFGSENEKIGELSETRKILAKSENNFETVLKIPAETAAGNYNLLINSKSDIASTFVQENILLGKPNILGGFAVLFSGGSDRIISGVILALFLAFAIFMVRRIFKFKRISKKGY